MNLNIKIINTGLIHKPAVLNIIMLWFFFYIKSKVGTCYINIQKYVAVSLIPGHNYLKANDQACVTQKTYANSEFK